MPSAAAALLFEVDDPGRDGGSDIPGHFEVVLEEVEEWVDLDAKARGLALRNQRI